ncbi:hypothetical protein B0H19DRAFT_1371479 [Mycena capillaripes]|nr:hypothetical protein B0H19DRAFT_1371479 [Mycena capillaripes]
MSMSVSHSPASSVPSSYTSSSSATVTTSSFAPLPTGCAGLSRPGTHASDGFQGCVVGDAKVLQSCCSSVGSTLVFAIETCGCPFNSAFLQTDIQNFFTCLGKFNQTGGCSGLGGTPSSAKAAPRPRWNAALIILGVSLLVGAVGA